MIHTGDVSVGEAGSESCIQYLRSGDLHCVDTGYSLIWNPGQCSRTSHGLKRRFTESQDAEKSIRKSIKGLWKRGDREGVASKSNSRVLP